MARRIAPGPGFFKGLAVAACIAALSLATSASPTAASVAIGQLAPDTSMSLFGGAPYDRIQATVTSGNSYVVPGTGTITSWSHNARSGAGQTLTMTVYRKVAEPDFYQLVGHDGPRPLVPDVLNSFPASVPVNPGDILGLNTASPVGIAAGFPAVESYFVRPGTLADGQSAAFPTTFTDFRLNVSAVFVPSSSFTLGGVTTNKKRGTAILTATLPNPGELTVSGNGVKASSAQTVSSKAVTVPGPAQLLIKAKGKKRKTLNDIGKVKLNVVVTYTPTGGDPSTQSTKVKLKKL